MKNAPESLCLPGPKARVRMVGIPVVALLVVLITGYAVNWRDYLQSLSYTLLFWEGISRFSNWISSLFPTYQDTGKRVAAEAVFVFSYVFVGNLLVQLLLRDWVLGIAFSWSFALNNYLLCLSVAIIITLIYESVYFFTQWKEKIRESERQKRELAQAQFASLRNQVNPHFLFNSLNTLSYLIEFEPERALTFVDRLSRVYRYVLKQRDRSMVSLADEMEVLRAYLHLLQSRFEHNLVVELDLPEDQENWLLPPLSLQMLIENAVKHNVINRRHPMLIRIQHEAEGYLRIENTYRPKHQTSDSGAGLDNLRRRLQALTGRPLRAGAADDLFVVELPITHVHAYADR